MVDAETILQKRYTSSLAASCSKDNAEAASIVEALSSPLFLLDREGFILRINHAAEEFLGKSRSLVLGRNLNSFYKPNALLSRMLDHSLTGGSVTSEVCLQSYDGQQQDVLAWLTQTEDEKGIVLTLFQHEVRSEMAKHDTQEKIGKSLGAMAFMLAHEIKNPLSGMRGAAQLLRQSARPEDAELLSLIMDECDRVARLIERVEHLSDDELAQTEKLNIHSVLDHVVLLAKGGFASHCQIEQRYDPSLPLLRGNFDQLVQLFLNIIKNAAEAAPLQNGRIQIVTSWQPRARSLDQNRPDALALPIQISIIDNGVGIAADRLPTLFTLPLSTKQGGHGLGLPIAARIAARHGGKIDVQSSVACTQMTISFPYSSQQGDL